MLLKLRNNLTKNEYEFNVNDWYSSKIFFEFEIKLKENMEDGEYNYYLYDGECLVANGLCQIGDYKTEIKEYKENKNKEKTYKVYNGK